MTTPLQKLSQLGQSVWVDEISREDTEQGGLQKMIAEDSVVGVTSNPAIFQSAIGDSDRYDEQLEELSREMDDPKEIFLEIARRDIQKACDILYPVHQDTNGLDGYVSLEVSPDLASDTGATIEEAERMHRLIDRPNLFVKIPATVPGLVAIEEMISRGRSINVTLVFSLERYREVARAYIRGISRLIESGGDPTNVRSVASFFVSRIDSEADKRLEAMDAPDDLKGQLAIVNAKLAYQAYKEIFSGEWEKLEDQGANRQRLLWASTSTKNPDYQDVMYVENLIGPETVNTMPKDTVAAFKDHGDAKQTLQANVDEARETFKRLREIGLDYEDVTEVLEREGVKKFADPFNEMLEEIRDKGRRLVRQS